MSREERDRLCGFDWLPLTFGALVLVLGFNVLSWTGFPVSGQVAVPVADAPDDGKSFLGEHTADYLVALFTLTLTISTIALWSETKRLASDAKDSANQLVSMERPYLTAGGDFGTKIKGFRLDVENHGKTAAFITGYDIKFATLATLQKETKAGEKTNSDAGFPLTMRLCSSTTAWSLRGT